MKKIEKLKIEDLGETETQGEFEGCFIVDDKIEKLARKINKIIDRLNSEEVIETEEYKLGKDYFSTGKGKLIPKPDKEGFELMDKICSMLIPADDEGASKLYSPHQWKLNKPYIRKSLTARYLRVMGMYHTPSS